MSEQRDMTLDFILEEHGLILREALEKKLGVPTTGKLKSVDGNLSRGLEYVLKRQGLFGKKIITLRIRSMMGIAAADAQIYSPEHKDFLIEQIKELRTKSPIANGRINYSIDGSYAYLETVPGCEI